MRKQERYDEYMSVSWRSIFTEAWDEITTDLKQYDLSRMKLVPPVNSEEYALYKKRGLI